MATKSKTKARAKARAKARVRDAAKGIVRNPHAVENKEMFQALVGLSNSGAGGYHQSKATRRARTRQDAKRAAINSGW